MLDSFGYFSQMISTELQPLRRSGQHLTPGSTHRQAKVGQQLDAKAYGSSSDQRDMLRLGRKQELQVHPKADMPASHRTH